MTDSILQNLIGLSRHLGEEWRDYVIIGEGNTSARADAQSFWIKASGVNLRTIDANGFVQLNLQRILDLIDHAQSDDDVTRGFTEAKIDPGIAARPSIETFLHALAIAYGGAQFAGHTHPVAVNAILCSQNAQALMRHITPDAITVCGASPVFVPYHDVGVTLARVVREALQKNIDANGVPPKVIYLQNHGMLALGRSVIEIENITAMAVKNARIMAQTFALGGPNYLTDIAAQRIDQRPDEAMRRAKFEGRI